MIRFLLCLAFAFVGLLCFAESAQAGGRIVVRQPLFVRQPIVVQRQAFVVQRQAFVVAPQQLFFQPQRVIVPQQQFFGQQFIQRQSFFVQPSLGFSTGCGALLLR